MKCNELSRKADRFCCNPGNHMKLLYKAEVKKNGTIVLHDAGVQDTDEFIESFRVSSDLRTLIARFSAGDTGVFNSVPTFDGDFTEYPVDLMQAFQILEYAKNAFAGVDPQSKAMYDNDFVKWIADYGSEKFLKSCGIPDPAQDVKEKKVEVTANE